ncbi:MAG: hypothetical protein ACK47B_07980 [Armatimonadota bacterium]
MKPGQWPDPRRMWETIRDAGYTPIPEQTELRVTGTLAREADRLVLRLDKMRHPVELPLTAAEGHAELLSQLEKQVGQGVELEGLWKPGEEEGSHGTLGVTAVVPPGERKKER